MMDKVKRKIYSIPISARVSAIYMICSVLQRGISFIVVPIYTRLVPSGEYGLYSLYQSWAMIVTLFATLNMWNYVYNNGMIRFENSKDEFTSALIGLSGVISMGFFSIIFIFREKFCELSGLSLYLLILMFLEIFFRPAFEYWYARQRFEYQLKKYVIVSLLISITQPVLCISFVKLSKRIQDGITGYALITGKVVCVLIVYFFIFCVLIRKCCKLYNKEIWKFALRFNVPLIPHFLAGIILQHSDRIMISKMCDVSSVAVYSIAYNAGMILYFVNEALINVIIPWTYKKMKKFDYQGFTESAILIIGLISIINIMLSICAPEIISIMAPKEYYNAIYIIPPVAISCVYMCLFNLYANIEYYYEETKLVAVASTLSAVLNIFLNYIFIKKFGYIAAGYTTVVCYICYAAFHLLFMKYVLKKNSVKSNIYNNVVLWVEAIAATIISIGVVVLYPYPIIRYCLLLFVSIIVILYRNKIMEKLKMYKTN